MIDSTQQEAIHRANQMPISLAAAPFLRRTDWGMNPDALTVIRLATWALENGATVPAMDYPELLLDNLVRRLGPEKVVAMAGEPADLADAASPIEAAVTILETLMGSLEALTGISTHRPPKTPA